MNGPGKEKKRSPAGGQALIEFLILLPVILLLFLATAEISKLFAISGKTEVAARYTALRYFRNTPFELPGHNYRDYRDEGTAGVVGDLFFEGSLDDDPKNPDGTDNLNEVDTGYYEFRPEDPAEFTYSPPELDSTFWDIIVAYFDPGDNIFPIRGNRVTFLYDLPSFPYKELRDVGGDQVTVEGDFVVLADTFSGDTHAFLDLLAVTGLIETIPAGVLTAGVEFLIFLILLAGGG